MIINDIGCSVQNLIKLEFSYRVLKNTQNPIKFPPEGPDLFYADGRTDRLKEANNRFAQVCENMQKNSSGDMYPYRGWNSSQYLQGSRSHIVNGFKKFRHFDRRIFYLFSNNLNKSRRTPSLFCEQFDGLRSALAFPEMPIQNLTQLQAIPSYS